MHRGLLFDLDGVIVDTAEYHYLAWKEIAGQLGIPFTRKDNERLKGISRMDSLEILLNIGRRKLGQKESRRYCEEKNNIYLRYIRKMGKDGLLPGVLDFLHEAKRMKYLLALGSASQNAELILERLELTACFDAVIDGTKISRAKPDPEVFVKGASALGVEPEECIVFEDSAAGIRAAHAGGMKAIGIGNRENLPEADGILDGFCGIIPETVEAMLIRRWATGFCRKGLAEEFRKEGTDESHKMERTEVRRRNRGLRTSALECARRARFIYQDAQ